MVGIVTTSLQSLLTSAVDYAGLFPPAELPLEQAVRNYATYRTGANSWMLGNFVIAAARLDELRARAPQSFSVSALVGPKLAEELVTIQQMQATSALTVDWIEAKVSHADQIKAIRQRVPRKIGIYFEVPVAQLDLLATVKEVDSRAKIRTGGVTAEAIPPARAVAQFIDACHTQRIPFKATAGLHHALRSEQKLTYQPDSPTATMYGFLNVMIAATFAGVGVSLEELVEILEERDPKAFSFEDDGITWRFYRMSNQQIREARKQFVSFGSCSFTEPLEELHTLALL